MDIIRAKIKNLVEYCKGELVKIPGIQLYSYEQEIVSGIISFTYEGYSPDELSAILDEEFDICVRSGYLCAPFVHEFLGTQNTGGLVRVSFGYFNEIDEVDKLVEAIKSL